MQRSDVGTVKSENEDGVKDMDKSKVHEYLVSIVKDGSNIEDIKIEYGQVIEYFNLDEKKAIFPLLTILDEICSENHHKNEPFLSAIVVSQSKKGLVRIPGPGFFKKWMVPPYRDYDGPSDGLEAHKIHEQELERVFNYWHNDNKNTCPVCGEVVPDGAKFCMECGTKIE